MGAPAVASIDILMNVVYHRQALLDFNPVDVGVGFIEGSGGSFSKLLDVVVSSVQTGSPADAGQSARAEIKSLAVWPFDGMAGVPLRMGGENPSPVNAADLLLVGTPISVHTDYWRTIEVNSLTLREFGVVDVVSGILLGSKNDPNQLLSQNVHYFIPATALKPNTVYSASFDGRIDGAVVTRQWSFRT